MKKTILLGLVFCAGFLSLRAQDDNRPSASERYPILPPFTLLAPDSSQLTRNDLTRHKKTLLFYFSPDCDHCRDQTSSLLKNIDRFKDIQLLMVTYQPFEEMVAFYKEYALQNYPGIKIGRDTQFFFVPFYRVRNLPFQALYDAKGNLIKTFEGNVSMDKILHAFESRNRKKR